jgi:hypothetical protein
MAVKWYVYDGTKTCGPFSPGQVRQLAAEQRISRDTQLRNGREGQWMPASNLKGLFPDEPRFESMPTTYASINNATVARTSPNIVKVLVVGCVAFCVFAILVTAFLNTTNDSPRNQRSNSTVGIGESLHVGYMSYRVGNAKWSNRLSNNRFLDRRPNAAWMLIGLTVRNDDTKARMVPPLHLVDDRGREYDSSPVLIDTAIDVLDTLNPGVSKTGYVAFDVPDDQDYRLKVSGGYWSGDDAYIRLDQMR